MVCLLYKYFTLTFRANIAYGGGQIIILHKFYTAANKPIEERRKKKKYRKKEWTKKRRKKRKMARNEKEKVKLSKTYILECQDILDNLVTGNRTDKVGNYCSTCVFLINSELASRRVSKRANERSTQWLNVLQIPFFGHPSSQTTWRIVKSFIPSKELVWYQPCKLPRHCQITLKPRSGVN